MHDVSRLPHQVAYGFAQLPFSGRAKQDNRTPARSCQFARSVSKAFRQPPFGSAVSRPGSHADDGWGNLALFESSRAPLGSGYRAIQTNLLTLRPFPAPA